MKADESVLMVECSVRRVVSEADRLTPKMVSGACSPRSTCTQGVNKIH